MVVSTRTYAQGAFSRDFPPTPQDIMETRNTDEFCSPLTSRYSSREMSRIWSPDHKYGTWRRLWLALAEAQQTLGLDINDDQLQELRTHLDDIDYEAVAGYEKTLRHDVMAHIQALGDLAPAARPILHLGATSQFINCNTDLLLLREGMTLVAGKLARLIDTLAAFSCTYRDLPALAFTHFQPAQPTTIGKRSAQWGYDFVLCLEDIEHRLDRLCFRGAKGATGTQASFLDLFDGDHDKVMRLDELVTEKMGWRTDRVLAISGQTYPRLVDAQILGSLAVTASALHKCATDIRLLAHRQEVEEPFDSTQVGSSAMAYKRNPMRCERVCSLARSVMSLVQNPLHTAANQWLERTLDDSANRRLVLPGAFLALDGALDVMLNVCNGLVVNTRVIRRNLESELPFMATERILMHAVMQGADRQEAHEVIRKHSADVAQCMKEEGAENDLLTRLQAEELFGGIDWDALLAAESFTGRAAEQVDAYVQEIVEPVRDRYPEAIAQDRVELSV